MSAKSNVCIQNFQNSPRKHSRVLATSAQKRDLLYVIMSIKDYIQIIVFIDNNIAIHDQ